MRRAETAMTKIKLCGMMQKADILAANELLPDYIGFVFAAGARRAVTPEIARELRGALDSRIRAVGVFADQRPEEIAEIAARVPLDCIQLHGEESEQNLERVRILTEKPVWRAFQVTAPSVLLQAAATGADGILLDSGKGSGKTFVWEWLREFSRPYLLAGGLDAANVGEAIRRLHSVGVDVSSALETDGQKDPEKMRSFVEAVHRADWDTEG